MGILAIVSMLRLQCSDLISTLFFYQLPRQLVL